MVDRPLLHDHTPNTISLITCEVIALIISLWQDDHKYKRKSAFYSANSPYKSNNNMALPHSFVFPSESLLPAIAAVLFLLFTIYIPAKDERSKSNSWIFPATLSLLFLLFSLTAIASEGLVRPSLRNWYWVVFDRAASKIIRNAPIPLVIAHCLHWLYRFLSNDRTPTILTGLRREVGEAVEQLDFI
jgi:hypothetical protein